MKGIKFFIYYSTILSTILMLIGIFAANDDSIIFGYFDDFTYNKSDEREFDQKLLYTIKRSPINNKTFRHQIILFVTNEGLLHFAKNALCSLSHSTDSTYLYVVVALDEISYISLRDFGANVLYYRSNFTHESVNYRNKIDFYNIVKIREHIAYKILNFQSDVIISDVDIVYLQDPEILFTHIYDFEVQCDSRTVTEIPDPKNKDIFWSVNLGFYKLLPTKANLRFIPIWEYQMELMPENHDQTTLWLLLRGKLFHLEDKNVLLADIKKILGEKSIVPLTIRYLDPLLAVNAGGAFLYNSEKWRHDAKERNISKPVICHFFHVSENSDKMALMKKYNLWYLDSQQKCMKTPPKGHQWPWWN